MRFSGRERGAALMVLRQIDVHIYCSVLRDGKEFHMKKGFGVYVTILAGLLSAAAGIFLQVQGGVFGAMKRQCYDPIVVGLLIGALVVALALIAIKKYGLAAAAVTAMSGVALCKFATVHDAYWYVADVFIAIDEKGFDQNFLIFAGLVAAAFVVGEIAIYSRKVK